MMPSFKLKFQTSQTTKLNNTIIVDKIVAKLNEKKYEVLEIKDDVIIFGRPFFELVWNHQVPYLLDGGNFIIKKSETETIVVMHYFIKTLYLLIISITFLIYMLYIEFYEGLLFFGVFFLIAGLIQFFITKNVGHKLLNDILTGKY